MLNKRVLPLIVVLLLAGCQAPVTPKTERDAICDSGDMMMQTTLWFGMIKPTGVPVSSSEWQQFVNNDVTPRFREGLSVYDAKGQWLGKGDKLARENSKALMLIHQPDRASSERIDALRDIYKKRFHQESVMRVDSRVCVAF